MYVFNQLKRVCGRPLLRVIYFALAHSLLQYCITSWGGSYENTIQKLRRTQNILLRIILHKPRLFSTTELYNIFDVPNTLDIYIYKTSIYAIKQSTNWTQTQTITRQSGQIRTERIHKSLYKRHFSFIGKKLYNVLPEGIKASKEKEIITKTTKRLVKEWIKDKQHLPFVDRMQL
uniref:Uncharacterized protein n=1 Tax=Cacopsylla melanoneura TaxID=428564 RepID=A0A8D9F9B8_9HEMI